ncbi:hypothetical protein MTO96_017122 [Rhipicephalus appendiculatus]
MTEEIGNSVCDVSSDDDDPKDEESVTPNTEADESHRRWMFDTTTLDGSMELRVWLEGNLHRPADLLWLSVAVVRSAPWHLPIGRCGCSPAGDAVHPDVHFLLRRCGPAKAAATPRGSTAVQASPPLERVSHRPRRPPPYDEAVTRLAAGTHHLLPPRGGDPPLQGLGGLAQQAATRRLLGTAQGGQSAEGAP